MSNYLARDVYWLWKWAWTYFPWRWERRHPAMARIVRRAYWAQVIKDGWFLGWPLWLGKRKGPG